MANNILLKKSSVAAKVPTTGDLDYGELALNYADGALYYKTSGNTIARLNPLEADTLGTVTARGATTSTSITLSGDPGVSITANSHVGRLHFSKTGGTAQVWQIGTSGNDATSRGFNIDDYTTGNTRLRIAHTTGDISLLAATYISSDLSLTSTTPVLKTDGNSRELVIQSAGVNGRMTFSAGGVNWLGATGQAYSGVYIGGNTSANQLTINQSTNSAAFGSGLVVSIANTTTSSTTGNGALVVGGGLGVAGAINAGGAITTTGLTVNGASSLAGDVTNVDSISFDLTAAEATGVGKLYWDAGFGMLRYGLGGGNVDIDIGQTQVAYVRNAESVTITKGQVVYLFGAQGDRPSVKLASNTSDATSAKTFGIVAENIAASADGFVVTVGTITGIDTSAYTPGDILWLGSTAGTFTTTKAIAPNHLVFVGVVQKANAGGGQIYVKPQNGYELDEIHDVLITSVGLNHSLFYDTSVNVWKNYAPSAARTNLGLGTIATQNANSVAITGGAIDGTPIGATTPSTGKFTTLQTTGNVTIGGDLTVSGTTTTVNATNLAVSDNLIYLNNGSTNSNPDLGFAANYNDGSYRHTGFFRDATDGYWKVFKNYTPEPDASIYIDTSHASFALADIQAANFRGALVGNADSATILAANRTINGVTFNGSANITITANTTNALTIGDGLSGTSFNGSAAVTIAADSTIARRADVTYIGTTSIALNRASAAQTLTGINGLTADSTTDLTLSGGSSGASLVLGQGTNSNVSITPSGIGGARITNALANGGLAQLAAAPQLALINSSNYGYPVGLMLQSKLTSGGVAINSGGIWAEWSSDNNAFLGFATTASGTLAERARITSAGKLLVGTTTATTNGGIIQLATHTTTDGGIGIGPDLVLHRVNANKVRLTQPAGGSGSVAFELYNGSGNSFRMDYGYPYSPLLYADDSLTVNSNGGSITFKTANSTTLTLNTSNGATLVGNLVVQGAGNSSVAGNLGVGTTTPSQKLEVSGGNISAINNGGNAFVRAIDGAIINKVQAQTVGDTAGVIGTESNHTLKLITNNTARITIDTSGNVGVGTTSPSQKLEVNGNIQLTSGGNIYGDGSNARLHLSNAAGSQLIYGSVSVKALAASVKIIGTSEEVSLQNNNGSIWLAASGNVGIGTTSPAFTHGSGLQVNAATTATIRVQYNSGYATELFADSTGTNLWQLSAASLTLGTNNTERVRIDSSGNVGIGTTTPAYKIDAVGASSADSYIRSIGGAGGTKGGFIIGNNDVTKDYGRFYWDNAANLAILRHEYTSGYLGLGANSRTTDLVILASNGNVGVGTATPGYKLEVAGTVRSDRTTTGTAVSMHASGIGAGQQVNLFLGKSDTTNNESTLVWHHIGDGSTNNYLGVGVFGSDDILNIHASGRVSVGSTANVGNSNFLASLGITAHTTAASGAVPYIQTYNGGATLNEKTWRMGGQTNGKFHIETVNDAYSSASTKVIVSQTGNVGIGVDPTEKLHVAGAARITGILYDSAYNAGTNGQVLTSTGTGTAWSSTGIAVSGNGNTNYIAKWSSSTGLTDSLIYETAGGNVGIGVGANPAQKLEISGNFGWGSEHVLSYSSLTTNSTTANQVITAVATTSFRTFKFIIQATDATAGKYQSQEILAIHNGSTVAHTEYTAINVGGAVATYDVDISASTVRLLCTPLSANSTVFKVSMQLIKV